MSQEFELPVHDADSPIPDLSVIDVNSVQQGGGARLYIVVATPLQGDEYSLLRLLRKVEVYLEFLLTEDFIREAGFATPENTKIVVALHPESDDLAVQLIERNKPWVKNNGAALEIEILEPQQTH